jgi:hypothetical protein
MTFVIRILGRPDELIGQFVETFDHNAPDGGFGTFTLDPLKAMPFQSTDAAIEFVFRRSTRFPYQADGSENRPLRASHIEVITLGRAILDCAPKRLL